MAVTATAMGLGRPVLAYVGAAAVAACITFTRPVMGSLLPAVTHAPGDLVAANVVTGFLEQLGRFVGPVVAGVLIVAGSPAVVFAMGAVLTGLAAALAMVVDRSGELFVRPVVIDAGDVAGQVLLGFSTLRRHARVRLLVVLSAFGGLTIGAADVLAVTFAGARLAGGSGKAGLLGGALGLGALAGAMGAAGLVRGGSHRRYLVASAVLVGAPFAALAGAHAIEPALVAFFLVGAGEAVLGLTTSIAVQRSSDHDVLARVFGIVEGVQMAAVAAGSVVVSLLASWASLGTAVVVLGVGLLTGVLGGVVRLSRLGGEGPRVDPAVVERLLADPVFAPLPAPAVERLARDIGHLSVGPGTMVVTEGDPGDLYYLVVSGVLDVSIAGAPVREMGPGQSFGEIALLRDVPRTATVVARTDAVFLTVGRDTFLEAVTGHPRSIHAARTAVEGFLGSP